MQMIKVLLLGRKVSKQSKLSCNIRIKKTHQEAQNCKASLDYERVRDNKKSPYLTITTTFTFCSIYRKMPTFKSVLLKIMFDLAWEKLNSFERCLVTLPEQISPPVSLKVNFLLLSWSANDSKS